MIKKQKAEDSTVCFSVREESKMEEHLGEWLFDAL